jgi:hypothetical protein
MESINRADKSLTTGLAIFSLGLGLVELIAPRFLARAIRIDVKPGLMRAFGLREIATGIGMLARPGSAVGPSARVAGDVMDMTVLAKAPRAQIGGGTTRLAVAVMAVTGVAALDLLAAKRLAAH